MKNFLYMKYDCESDSDIWPENAWAASEGDFVDVDEVEEDGCERRWTGSGFERYYYGGAVRLAYDDEREVCLDTRRMYSGTYDNGSFGRHDYVGPLADGRLFFSTRSEHQGEYPVGKIIEASELVAYCHQHGVDLSEVEHLLT